MSSQSWSTHFSQLALQTHPPQINWLMAKALETPGIVSLAAGFVDQNSLPYRRVGLEMAKMLENYGSGAAALQYGTTRGDGELRSLLHQKLNEEKVILNTATTTTDSVLIGSGSQQLLYLLCETLLDDGDIILMEATTYFVVLGAFHSRGAQTIGLDTDEEGIKTEALRECLEHLKQEGNLHRVKLLYAMTYSANPTGVTWSTQRRQEILSVVHEFREHGAPILFLEDGAYRRLGFPDDQPDPIKSFDPENEFVFYTESFSKTFSPGMRLGFAVGPQEIIDKMADIKGNHDFGSSNLCQQIIRRMIKQNVFDEHVNNLRRIYRQKWDMVQDILRETFPPEAHWITPQGGFYTWVTLPEEYDTGGEGAVFEAALHEKVLYVPGALCYSKDRPESNQSSSIRLSFGLPDHAQLREGCQRLGQALRNITSVV